MIGGRFMTDDIIKEINKSKNVHFYIHNFLCDCLKIHENIIVCVDKANYPGKFIENFEGRNREISFIHLFLTCKLTVDFKFSVLSRGK